MVKPPSALHPVPIRVTPPLVPGGTFLPFITRIVHPLESIPSSDASVSAKLVVWCTISEHAKADRSGLLTKSILHGIELQNIGEFGVDRKPSMHGLKIGRYYAHPIVMHFRSTKQLLVLLSCLPSFLLQQTLCFM
jgi:hypothetical protein